MGQLYVRLQYWPLELPEINTAIALRVVSARYPVNRVGISFVIWITVVINWLDSFLQLTCHFDF